MTTKAEPVSSGQSLNLHPLNDCVLVELKQSSDKFSIKEGKWDSRTEGIVIEIPKERNISLKYLIGKRVHFEEYKEGARIKRDNKVFSFIKVADIRGWED